MEPLLEKDMEQAARRRGVTKSQFIIEAVERALGRRDPAALYLKIMQEAAQYKVSDEPVPDEELPAHKAVLRQSLRAKYARQQDDFAAFLAQREAGQRAVEK
jgi:RHH-type rel operon transcriptional repressor/antitoxin RelB